MDRIDAKFPTQFESERLIMRCYHPGDGTWYYAMSMRNRKHLMRFEADNVAFGITDETAAERLIQELAQEWKKGSSFFIGTFDKLTGDFVAQIYVGLVDRKLPEYEIGYFADVNHQGQGYVTEAVKATLDIIFNQLDAHRVRLECAETNLRSIKVAERCNMTKEGRLRENKIDPDGTYRNSLIYSLLASEFKTY